MRQLCLYRFDRMNRTNQHVVDQNERSLEDTVREREREKTKRTNHRKSIYLGVKDYTKNGL